ncbi:MAG: hypothetical protein ABIL91_07715 [candidate division WOR-3 bacterium]
MNKEKIVTTIKEKGPIFLLGVAAGAVLISAFVYRDKIARVVNQALGRCQQSVVKNEHLERS